MNNTGYKKVSDPRLKRYIPKDWSHVEKHPLTASIIETVKPAPVVVGVNWYSAFDSPRKEKDGRFWVGKNSDRLGYVRGGHCICMPSNGKLDTWKNYIYYNQRAEGACFKPDVLISMADGSLKPIQELRLFEKVLTAEGNEGAITHLFGRCYDSDIHKIKLWGHNVFECTSEHPVLTKRGYIPANQIVVGDEVCLVSKMPFENNELLVLPFLNLKKASPSHARRHEVRFNGFGGTVEVKIKKMPDVIRLTKNLGRLFGLYLAEGGTTENKVVLTFGKHEEDTLVKESVSLIKDCFDIDARIQYRPASINVVVYGKEWRVLFSRLFPGNVWSKSVSAEVLSGNKDFLEAMFYGWVSGDGHRRRGEMTATSVSKTLAMAMYRIAGSLGLCPVIKKVKPGENAYAKIRQFSWEVLVRETMEDKVWSPDRGHFVEKHGNGSWRKVRKIEIEHFNGVVYNLEVQGDNSYVADGIGVHNCVGFGSSRAMSLLNKKLYNAWWLWDEAKLSDDFTDTNPGDENGSTVRAAMDVLRFKGHVAWNNNQAGLSVNDRDNLIANKSDGIVANKWATSVDDLFSVLQNPLYEKLEAIPFVNSWGTSYPWFTWVPCKIWERLLKEDGEMTMITDF